MQYAKINPVTGERTIVSERPANFLNPARFKPAAAKPTAAAKPAVIHRAATASVASPQASAKEIAAAIFDEQDRRQNQPTGLARVSAAFAKKQSMTAPAPSKAHSAADISSLTGFAKVSASFAAKEKSKSK